MNAIKMTESSFSFTAKIKPNASNNRIVKFNEEELEISIKAPPDRERANKELIKYLSAIFECTKDKIQISNGAHSSNKTIKIDLPIDLNEITRLIRNEMC